MGKIGLDRLSYFIEKHRSAMVKNNGIGWDYSHTTKRGIDIIAKIEPMMFYNFLEPEENAQLSFIFALNDFLTSGVWPEYAMIDFENIKGAGEKFEKFMESMLKILKMRRIKLLAGHTGDYGNIEEGISGSISLLSVTRKPRFSLNRVKKPYKVILMGNLGLEYRYFYERLNKLEARTKITDLSIERYLPFLDNKVYYVHDLAEGGLARALLELTYVLGHGFQLHSSHLEKIIALNLPVDKAVEVSSSGAVIVIANSEYRIPLQIPNILLEVGDSDVLLDGKPLRPKRDIIQELFKNK